MSGGSNRRPKSAAVFASLDYDFLFRTRIGLEASPLYDYFKKDVNLHDPAEIFHENTKFTRAGDRDGVLADMVFTRPEFVENQLNVMPKYPHLPAVRLPFPAADFAQASFAEVAVNRRSVRAWTKTPLTLAQASGILYYSYGLTRKMSIEAADGSHLTQHMRPVPSGGALYPLRLFVAAQNVEGLEPGLYHYDAYSHSLEAHQLGQDVIESVRASCAMREFLDVDRAAMIVFLAPTFWRTRAKYGMRGYRFSLLEAGHVAQNLCMAAVAGGVDAIPAAGFYEDELNRIIGLDGVEESAIYGVIVGEADPERDVPPHRLMPGELREDTNREG